jgi:hypothetical protein
MTKIGLPMLGSEQEELGELLEKSQWLKHSGDERHCRGQAPIILASTSS